MADKLFTLHIVILNHPAALPDAAEQPLVTGRNGSRFAGCRRFLIPRTERRLPGRESVADRPNPAIRDDEIATAKRTFADCSKLSV